MIDGRWCIQHCSSPKPQLQQDMCAFSCTLRYMFLQPRLCSHCVLSEYNQTPGASVHKQHVVELLIEIYGIVMFIILSGMNSYLYYRYVCTNKMIYKSAYVVLYIDHPQYARLTRCEQATPHNSEMALTLQKTAAISHPDTST